MIVWPEKQKTMADGRCAKEAAEEVKLAAYSAVASGVMVRQVTTF